MKSITLIFGVLVAKFSFAEIRYEINLSEKKYTQEEYISAWKEIAIQQMNEYKIPASITLAQGILESGNGNSVLAKEANNHFGIKCSDWKGDTFYKESGGSNDCFRKYTNAKKSYEDHSNFLTSRTRYSSLFLFEITDYKSWAKGLKDAGYATSPTYPQRLIDLIEKLKLYEFDKKSLYKDNTKGEVEKAVVKSIMANAHVVLTHKNNIKYIVAKKGDTYYRISKEFSIGMWQLYKYNEFGDKKDYLIDGDIVYLAPKKRKSKSDKTFEVKQESTIRDIAQKEGVRVQRLMKMNSILFEDEVIEKGVKIKLK